MNAQNTPSESAAEIQAHATATEAVAKPRTTPERFDVGQRYAANIVGKDRQRLQSNKLVRRVFRRMAERLNTSRLRMHYNGKGKGAGTVETVENRVGTALAEVGRLRVMVGKFAKNSHARRRLLAAELEHRRAERKGEAKP